LISYEEKEEHMLPPSAWSEVHRTARAIEAPLTIRPAHAADRVALSALAELDSAAPLAGDAIVAEHAGWWGTRWFMIPNPIYGSWERAITGGSGTPCEQQQKKLDALR
jgi:hypothetical protein